jgi:acetamidase/formamidase
MVRILRAVFCGFVVLIALAGFTQAEVEKETVPVIEVEMPTYNFERVPQGEVVKHDFRVFNRGTATLEIKNVRPG